VTPKPIEVRKQHHREDGGIDCELLHEVHGWMPFTARADDAEEFGRQLYEELVNGKHGAVAPSVGLTDAQARALWKIEREALVAAITVTTAAGNTFDGDELSQGRMARAILGLQSKPASETTTWTLADNRSVLVSALELTEALALAGQRQTEIWTQA
jgi:hypothetical protein